MHEFRIQSPNNQLELLLSLEDGSPFYQVLYQGKAVLNPSPLGLCLTDADLSSGLIHESITYDTIDEVYTLPAFKKSECHNHANTLLWTLRKEDKTLQVEARAYDDGAAVRLLVPGEGAAEIVSETTGYALPDSAVRLYAQKLIFSYEDHYNPVPFSELHQNPFAFPVLVEACPGVFTLYAEAGVFGNYGGSHLRSTKENKRLLTVRKAPDKLDNIHCSYPIVTPWRVIMTGSLADIVESNLLENLNPPSILDDTSFVKGGLCAWNWMVENGSTRDINRIHDFVNYAAEMGWSYYLADGGWPGYIDIPELVKYCAERNIKVWIWEHSAQMRDYQTAYDKMKLWSSWGVVGLKIDFFESDGQERIAQYDMLAKLAAEFKLMLNFHGATKPAGEIRTWPHVMTREGIMGGEYLQNFSTFLPMGPDAAHNCTLPFTRCAVGPADYTPVIYQTYLTGTTDAHQTALTVVGTSYIQNISEKPEVVLNHPCKPFLMEVPSCFDETKLLEGEPASHVTMARRKGKDWYLGAICARLPRNVELTFDFLEDGITYEADLYCDDLSDELPFDVAVGALPAPTEKMVEDLMNCPQRPASHQHDIHKVKVEHFTLHKGDEKMIPLSVNGGFAMAIHAH